MPVHETDRNHIARGLAMINHLIDVVGDGTYLASATNVATFQSTNLTRQAAAHEDIKASFNIANRYVNNLSAMDIFTDSDIAAGNTTALLRAQFSEDDPTLDITLRGSRG